MTEITYGFDEEVMNRWFKDPAISMQALIQEKELQDASESQAAVADTSDIFKDVIDEMMS